MEAKSQMPANTIGSFEMVKKVIADKINWEILKDSTAIYTFCLKIDIKGNKRGPTIECSINNPEISNIFLGFSDLQKLDYSSIIKKGKKRFLVRCYIFVLSSDYSPKVVDIYSIPKSVKFLHQVIDNSYEDLGTFIQQYDKKVYN